MKGGRKEGGERELESQGGGQRGKRQRATAFSQQVTEDQVREDGAR